MMLEIRTLSVAQRFKDLFSYRSWILSLFALEVFFFLSQGFFDLTPFFFIFQEDWIIFFQESNLAVNFGTLLQRTDHLRGIGGVLFTEYKFSLILAALLLLLSMIGSIVMTLDSVSFTTIKVQNANIQSLRQPLFVENAYRSFFIK
jgi:NADH:ubiquinone oxidoreductase subunit 6 (subunit J)